MWGCVRGSDLKGAVCAALFAALAATSSAWAEEPAGDVPRRVVSMNLCTDQLALALADPSQIVSVSHFATDPSMSVHWKQAEDLPVNYGRAE